MGSLGLVDLLNYRFLTANQRQITHSIVPFIENCVCRVLGVTIFLNKFKPYPIFMLILYAYNPSQVKLSYTASLPPSLLPK